MVIRKTLLCLPILLHLCLNSFGQVSDIDGNTYSTVKIGRLEWMSENLRTTKYSDGTEIYYPGTDYDGWQNNTFGAFAWYNNDETTYKTAYGALYNWHAVNNAAGLCPTGWHIPSRAEFDELANEIGGHSIAGGKLKQIGITYWLSPNTGATNESGFSGRGHGYRATGSTFGKLKEYGEFWTSGEQDEATAWAYYLRYNYADIGTINEWKENGFGVRCVKDNISTGLAAFYPFNNNVNDESGNANNGINHGATPTTDRFGNENSAFLFNGTDSYISVATPLIPAGGNEYTISLWFNTNEHKVQEFISQWTYANSGNSFFLGLDFNNIRFSDDWSSVYFGGDIILDHWYNLIAISTADNAFLYLNGNLVAEKGSPLYYTGIGNVSIGVQGEYGSEYANGKIDDIRIYSRILSNDEIQEIFHEGNWVDVLPGEYASDGNTMLLLHMNELSGTDVADASSFGNNGTAFDTDIVDGRFGKARGFSGAGYVSIPPSSSIYLGDSDFSIEMWVKSAPVTDNNVLLSKGGGEGSTEYKIFLWGAEGNNGRVICSLSDGYSVNNTVSMRRVDDDQWHHIAVTRTGDNREPIRLYIDGVLDGENPSPGLLGVGSYASLDIGTGLASGVIDEIRISNTIRQPHEFNLQLPPKNLTASISGNAVTLNWENGGGYVDVQYYSIYKGTDSTNLTFINNTTETTFTDYVDLGGSYFYRVSAVDITFFESQKSYADSVFYNGLIAFFPFNGYVDGGTANGAILTSDRFFKDHRAYFFDGVDDDISINPIDLSASQQATFSAWIKPNAVDGTYEILRQDGSPDFLLSFQGPILSFGLAAGGIYDELDVTINPSDFLDDRWHLVTAVYDGSKKMLYRDGILIGENSQSGLITFSPGANTRIGSQSGVNEFFNGKIDEIRIYNRALSETEINNLFNENGYMQTTDVESNTYKTVVIGTQEWMGENLKTTKYSDGWEINYVSDNAQWSNVSAGAYSWYNNDFNLFGNTYGALYNWLTVNDGRGLCPSGWHIPAENEWVELVNFLGGVDAASGKLREAGTVHWADPNLGATNESGFTALPGGIRHLSGEFADCFGDGYWWSSTENSSTNAFAVNLAYEVNHVFWDNLGKNYGMSIRCLRNVFGSGLVAYYPLNGNAEDLSGNGFNGTPSNISYTADRFGDENNACLFQKDQSSNIIVPIYDISGSNKLTIQAWVNPSELTGSPFSQIFYHNRFYLAFYPNENVIRFNVETETGSQNFDTPILPLDYIGSWHLLTAVYDGVTQKIYSDGILLGEVSASGIFAYTDWGYPSIGSYIGESQFYYGTIDEVNIFNRALSQDEIKKYYANYHPPKNLAGNAVQPGQNKLTWSSENIGNYTKFRIYRNGNYYDEVNVSSANDTVFFDNGAVPNTVYQYQVSSVDVLGYESIPTDATEVLSIGNEVLFTDIEADLIGLAEGSDAKWGDYNNDGLLDILITGKSENSGYTSRIYRNNGDNSFSYQSGISITGVNASAIDWGDYNNDGNLDFLITGYTGTSETSKLYRNNGNETFSEQTDIKLNGVRVGSVKWGDYNNDGKLDIIITGDDAPDAESSNGVISKIYRNNGDNTFTEQSDINLPNVYTSSVSWGDYDNDNDLDLLISGENPPNGFISKVYRNYGDNSFAEETGITLVGVSESRSIWGDYDNDGDLDILISGFDGTFCVSLVYKNNGDNTFSIQNEISLIGICNSSVAWGDYDNDGDLDILISGHDGTSHITKIYRNDGLNVFTEQTEISLENISLGSVNWGDYDNDGDLDILLTGQSDSGPVAKIYRNESNLTNSVPTTPNNLNANTNGGNVTLTWDPATDNETPQQSLTYNVRVGTNPGTFEIVSPHALSDGKLTTPAMGNAQLGTSFVLNNLTPGTYYWSVQSVDNGYLGSAWSEEKNFSVLPFDEASDLYAVSESSSAWGDYDNDGDLDIIITGNFSTYLYRNEGNSEFTRLEGQGFPMVKEGSTAWGDYDSDGDLDLLITGDFGSGKVSRIYRNDGNDTFIDIGAPFIGLSQSSAEWGDMDNDGDLDILLTGNDSENLVSALIYMNNGDGSFSPITSHGIEPVRLGRTKFGDYDYDGDLDILLIGWKLEGSPITRIYRNQGNYSFQPMDDFGLTNIHHGSMDWGDYDCDGDLDIIICGHTGSEALTRIYRNEGTSFVEQWQITLTALAYSNVQFGDYDNDGWLDIVISGYSDNSEYLTHIFRNNTAGSFELQNNISLPGTYRGSAEWGDYDGDGDLDIALTGESSSGSIAKIFRNNIVKKNMPPTAPTNLNYSQNVRQINLWWAEPSEQETPWVSLTYNVRIGTSPGASDIVSPHSLPNGMLTVPSRGNATSTRTFVIKNMTPGTYYWSVQAVDNGFAGGPWVDEQSFTVNDIPLFTDINVPLLAVSRGTCSWGDYDNDGDLDILFNGSSVATNDSRVYKNDGNDTFTDIESSIQGVYSGSSAWGDYDNDGDLDVLVTGSNLSEGENYFSAIYRNDGGNFTYSGIYVEPLGDSYAAWGDYNNDGLIDFVLMGDRIGADAITTIYKNIGGYDFQPQQDIELKPFFEGAAAWGDIDNDGDLDLVISGWNTSGEAGGETVVYRNDGNNTFTEQTGNSLAQVYFSSVAFGDYNGDTSIDLIVTGTDFQGNPLTAIYINDTNGNFTEQTSFFVQHSNNGSSAWGDYDNDGYLDLLLAGNNSTLIYRNNGDGTLSQTDISLANSQYSSCAWGDYDGDGDLDILLIGGFTKVYRNESLSKNSPPSIPTNLQTSTSDDSAMLSWDLSIDSESSTGTIYYNVRVGTSSGGQDIVSPNALINGKLTLPSMGNAQMGSTFRLNSLAPGTYYWSVQAIDNGYAASGWANEQIFTIEEKFTEMSANLPGLSFSTAKWGDYDNDEDLDILLTGLDNYSNFVSRIFRNEGDFNFTEQTDINYILGLMYSSADWGDYDNDGDLDILLIGHYGSGYSILLFKNNGNNSFTEVVDWNIMRYSAGTAQWGDFDNDGKLDFLLAGINDTGSGCTIYRNKGNDTFEEVQYIPMQGSMASSAHWGDYDNDNDLDIILTGGDGEQRISKIFRNENSTFVDQTDISFIGVNESSVQWGDFDSDGDLDVVIIGNSNSNPRLTQLYRNDGDNIFTEITNSELLNIACGSVHWGDFNNDGKLDLATIGHDGSKEIAKVYRNEGENSFAEQKGMLLSPVSWGSVQWGDADNDGDLDLLITGSGQAKIFRNNSLFPNSVPSAPANLSSIVSTPDVTLTWDQAYDNETNSATLTYNVRVGTTPGGYDIVSPHSFANGRLKTPSLGNTQLGTTYNLKDLAPGVYYWSVQAIDNGYLGGLWADEQSFTIMEQFTEIDPGITGAPYGSAEWGDYNNDGYLDLLVVSGVVNVPYVTKIYKNNGDNTFTEQTGIELIGLNNSSADWGDYDNDGYLDIIITGNTADENLAKIYRNNGNNTFTEQDIPIPGANFGSLRWGDYDNDGDMDILWLGGFGTKIYRNNGNNSFTEQQSIELPDFQGGISQWIDYNNDGYLDFTLGGVLESQPTTLIFKNNGNNSFSWQDIYLSGISDSYFDWADYDNDGDLDIIIAGWDGTNNVTKIFSNNGDNTFTEKHNWLPGVMNSRVKWGDYNNDGNSDFLLVGQNTSIGTFSKIFKNNGNDTFSEQTRIILPGVLTTPVSLADIDNDGDLDILITNVEGSSRIYLNNANSINTPPDKINSLNTKFEGSKVTMYWDNATDIETPSMALSYNVKVGSSSGGIDIVSPNALNNGKLTVPELGNAQLDNNFILKNLPDGIYYWSVQAVDNGFAGGSWSDEVCFLANSNTISGLQNVCQKQNYALYSVAFDDNLTYLWSVENGEIIEGQDSNDILVSWNEGVNQGTVYLTRTDISSGCSRTDAFPVNILNSLSTIPEVIKKGRVNILICTNSDALSYEWFKYSNKIANATKQYYVARDNYGDYQVEIVNNLGCRGRSEVVPVTSSVSLQTPLVIYPNPGEDNVTFDVECDEVGAMEISIVDSYGVTCKVFNSEKKEKHVVKIHNISGLPKGLYLVTLKIEGVKIDSQKLVVN